MSKAIDRAAGAERAEYLDPRWAAFWREHGERALDVVRAREQGERQRAELEDAGQLDLFA